MTQTYTKEQLKALRKCKGAGCAKCEVYALCLHPTPLIKILAADLLSVNEEIERLRAIIAKNGHAHIGAKKRAEKEALI